MKPGGVVSNVTAVIALLTERIARATHAALMLVGTVPWFASAPFWMLETKPHA